MNQIEETSKGPILWRMVRSVLNPTRLRILKLIYGHAEPLCVRQVSRLMGMDEPVASIYLRQMNEQGLLNVQRHEIKVLYRPWPDCPCSEARRFQSVLAARFREDESDGWELRLMTQLRAFSHFNRLAILVRLSEGVAGIRDLRVAMGTCVKTIEHHLEFLYAAGLLHVMHHAARGYEFKLMKLEDPVLVTLLEILRDGVATGVSYRNETEKHSIDSASRSVLRNIAAHERNLRGAWMRRSSMTPVKGYLPNSLKDALTEDES